MSTKRGPRTTWAPRAEKALRLKVTLKYIKPPIWRRFDLPDNYNLGLLHDVIQIVMGWGDCHLHAFRIGERHYASMTANDMVEMENEAVVILRDVFKRPKQKFSYEYDFGDGWEHEFLLEEIRPIDPKVIYPVCVAGSRACPPEDCGGVSGYYEILEALRHRKTEEQKELLEWLGKGYDPECFDLDAVNRRLTGKR